MMSAAGHGARLPPRLAGNSSAHRVAFVVLLASWAAFLAGCISEESEQAWSPATDLTEASRWGVRETATRFVDFTGDSPPVPDSGWARPETDAEGRVFAWSIGHASELSWTVLEPRDRTLVFRGWPFDFAGAEPQTVRVSLGANGVSERVGEFEMKPGLHEYTIQIPAHHWQQGPNILRLESSRATRPSDVSNSTDSRRLAAAWSEVRLSGARTDTEDPRLPVTYGDRIFLPWDSRLDVFVDLPEGAALVAERVSFRGDGRLLVDWLGDSAAASARGIDGPNSAGVALSEPPTGPIPLKNDAGLHRLRFHAQGDDGTSGGVMLIAPRISIPGHTPPADLPAAAAPAGTTPDLTLPDVFVLYVVDTLRADQLAAWTADAVRASRQGEMPVPTPFLDTFATESVVFRNTTAQSPWTKASMASIFTGLWPPAHGAIDRDDRLDENLPYLPELMQQAGWRTEAVVTNPNLKPAFGFARGFDRFEYLGEEADAFDVNRAVAARLLASEPPAGERLFLYVHVLDPHSPYDPIPEWRERIAPEASAELARQSLRRLNDVRQKRTEWTPDLSRQLFALYRAEIALTDAAFGELLALLTDHGATDPAVLFVSDHGEEFMEHGNLEHGRTMHGESLWVPMALRWPGVEPAIVDRRVQHLDVLPTLLHRLGASTQANLPGADLLVASEAEDRPLFSHLHLDGAERASVVHDGFKAIVEFRPGCERQTGHRPERRWQLYDVENDPGETADLSDTRPVRLGWLGSLLREQLGDCNTVPAASHRDVELDDETRRSLEALGYL